MSTNWDGDETVFGEVTPGVTVTRGEIVDISITAVEGGINYWASIVTDRSRGHGYARDAVFDLLPNDAPSWVATGIDSVPAGHTGPLRVTPSTIVLGLRRFSELTGRPVRDLLVEVDAESADAIVQSGLFGRIVFS